MNIQKPGIPQVQIDQLKQLFSISLEICKEKAAELILTHPRNIIVVQVLAACESLLKNYHRAIELYKICLEIDPDCIAFLNNFAWNHIQIGDYQMAGTHLNHIKQKWNHPAIYLNLAVTYERASIKDPVQLDKAVQKMEMYCSNYPSFQESTQRGLIYKFELKPEQIYDKKEIKEFSKEVLESVIVFQKMLHMQLDIEKISEVLEKLQPKVAQKLDKQKKYGIRIPNQIKATIEVMQAFRTKIIPCCKKEWINEISNYLIGALLIINSNIFEEKIDNDCDYELIENSYIFPCVIQLEQTAKDILAQVANHINPEPNPLQKPRSELSKSSQIDENDEELKARKEMDEEVKKEEKDNLDKFERNDLLVDEQIYKYRIRLNDIEEISMKEKKYIQSILRVEKETIITPLFLILNLRKNDKDMFYVYINKTKIKNEILTEPTLPNLSNLKNHCQIKEVLKYYHILNMVLKFYNFYGTNNFEYKLGDVVTTLELTHFVNLVTPILNQIFQKDDFLGDMKLGWVFNQIHHALAKYFDYTTSQEYLKRMKRMLKKINQICGSQKPIVESLINDILDEKHRNYREILLSHELTEANGSTKQHFYFNWKLNRYHLIHGKKSVRSAFQEQDNWIISNVCLILITLAEKELRQQDQSILCEAFTDCFHHSGHVSSYKKQILDKFYASNHVIPPIQKAGTYLRKIIRDIIPF